MKKITTIALSLITLGLFAQNPKEKNVGDFYDVKVFDRIEVNLVKSDEEKVIISGRDADDVEVINKNGKLKIRMQFDKIFDGANTFVEVHYKDLEIIDANEGAVITSNELIEQSYVHLRSQEGGRIKVGLDVDRVEVRSVTGGIVQASGTSKTQEVTLNTGGIYEGRQLQTEKTKITVRAAGEAEVNATETVDVKVRAGGDVDIYGNPRTVNKSTFLGGRVRVRS
ncbi:head GIN domain-containing protein [Spongiivirga sp. MCCC 1A20706]|uniref:head GIN domain-containing protein n=1 Tax=Spongiivirga sp. MCCC 1A20706 TaxID=3160963 RepID=UPI00397765A4